MRLFPRRQPPQRLPPTPGKRVRELEVATARLVREGFAGEYHAAFHGRGLEFSQVREYQPGDDIRTIDWNVTARSGIPHVKQFIEERDLTIVTLLDVSGSMDFGSLDRRKADLAAELTSVLGFAAVQNGDRAGLVAFSDRVVRFEPPRRGRKHVQELVRSCIEVSERPSGMASLDSAARLIQRVLVKRSVLVVISDFIGPSTERTLRQLAVKHDVIAFAVSDPRERYLPSRGLVRLVDSETGERVTVDLKKAGSLISPQSDQEMQRYFRRMGIDFVPFSTAVPYDRILLRFFENRISRPR